MIPAARDLRSACGPWAGRRGLPAGRTASAPAKSTGGSGVEREKRFELSALCLGSRCALPRRNRSGVGLEGLIVGARGPTLMPEASDVAMPSPHLSRHPLSTQSGDSLRSGVQGPPQSTPARRDCPSGRHGKTAQAATRNVPIPIPIPIHLIEKATMAPTRSPRRGIGRRD